MNIFEQLGVRTIINAKGTASRLSGGPMRAEIAAAMAEASGYCVDMAELEALASQRIAEATGAQAGYVASGAAACLLLGAAACMARLEPGRMARLPETRDMKNEIIMARSQRNQYDHAIRAAGATIVEVGLPDRFAGAGVRDAEPWEIAEAITERTAAVFYVADEMARPALGEVVREAHARDVPVIVDAAAQLPPQANLRRFIAEGADLVAYSGGKALGGPQASGILCGRRDLVMSAALQHLDLDIEWEQWFPPASLIDKSQLRGVPPHGIGRPCKVGKEAIVGLLSALQFFLAEGDATRHERWLKDLQIVMEGLGAMSGATARLTGANDVGAIPTIEIALAGDCRLSARALIVSLMQGQPSVHLDPGQCDRGIVRVNPVCLKPGEAELVARAIRLNLSEPGASQ
jgi:L-seryl-tRNA(Ser) seleniumtransferase